MPRVPEGRLMLRRLRRRTPLRRSPMRRGRRRSRYARRPRDLEFMRLVKRLPCSVRVDPPDPQRRTPCRGRVEADHMGERGLGQKADDRTCAPMCEAHHRERTAHSGAFRDLTRDQVRVWRARAIAHTASAVAAVAERLAGRPERAWWESEEDAAQRRWALDDDDRRGSP